MKRGLGIFIWQIAVALYLMAIGVMGLSKGRFDRGGDLGVMLGSIFKGDAFNIVLTLAAIIAFIAGIAIILDLIGAKIPILSLLVFIIAIIWAVFVVLRIIGWLGDWGWAGLRDISVSIMVLSSLLVASGKFE